MQFDFRSAIDALNKELPFGSNFSFENSRTRLVPSEYLLNTILPQEGYPTYNVKGGTMRIYPTMAQMMPMDTPPKPIGAIESSFFNENTPKWGGMMHFPEEKLRELQEIAQYAAGVGTQQGLSTGSINEANAKRAAQAVLHFSDILLKAQWDNLEWLRGQALTTGAIALTNSGLDLAVDYDLPAANKPAARTGTNGYGGSTSKWWSDLRTTGKLLSKFRIIMNTNTYYAIIDQAANNIRVVDGSGDSRQIIRFVGTNETASTDQRDRSTIILYDKSVSAITPKGLMKAVPVIPDGKIIMVGESEPDGFELYEGSTPDPIRKLRLGYTHIGPTVEGGQIGIWSRVFTPEAKPYQLLGETAMNALPMIQNPKKLVILTTDLP